MDPAMVAQIAQMGLDLSVIFSFEYSPLFIMVGTGLLSRYYFSVVDDKESRSVTLVCSIITMRRPRF
jgi:hypothetical protein